MTLIKGLTRNYTYYTHITYKPLLGPSGPAGLTDGARSADCADCTDCTDSADGARSADCAAARRRGCHQAQGRGQPVMDLLRKHRLHVCHARPVRLRQPAAGGEQGWLGRRPTGERHTPHLRSCTNVAAQARLGAPRCKHTHGAACRAINPSPILRLGVCRQSPRQCQWPRATTPTTGDWQSQQHAPPACPPGPMCRPQAVHLLTPAT